jgi:hypothetical protein
VVVVRRGPGESGQSHRRRVSEQRTATDAMAAGSDPAGSRRCDLRERGRGAGEAAGSAICRGKCRGTGPAPCILTGYREAWLSVEGRTAISRAHRTRWMTTSSTASGAVTRATLACPGVHTDRSYRPTSAARCRCWVNACTLAARSFPWPNLASGLPALPCIAGIAISARPGRCRPNAPARPETRPKPRQRRVQPASRRLPACLPRAAPARRVGCEIRCPVAGAG